MHVSVVPTKLQLAGILQRALRNAELKGWRAAMVGFHGSDNKLS